MPAATNRTDLLSVTQKEYAKLRKLLSGIDAKAACAPAKEEVTIKEIVGHRAHWIGLFLGWYRDGQAGKEVFFPAKGFKWNQLKAFNADLRKSQAVMSWEDVCQLLEDNNARLVGFLTDKSDADLYGGPMKGAHNKWTPGRWAEAAGPSHFRSAVKYIRACLREQDASGGDN